MGWTLTALETASDDRIYDWKREDTPEGLRRHQIFPGRIFNDIPPRELDRGMTAALDHLQPDAVAIHSYGYPDARAALMWCRRHRRAAVLMSDSRAEDAPRQRFREWLKSRLVRQYDSALLAGSPQRRYYETLGLPSHVMFDGYDVVDNAYFAASAAEAKASPEHSRSLPGLSDPRPFWLASNRFIPRKDLDVLIHGYALYRRRIADPRRLILLGDGPEREKLEAIVAQEGLQDDVTFAGFQQIAEIPAYYALADALIHTAQADQWALVVNEAMASGLPVVVSRGTGCAEDLVSDTGAGFVFETGDPEDLSQRLLDLHSADLAAMGASAKACIALWDLDRFTTGMIDAVTAAAPRARREPDPVVALMVGLMRRMSSVTALHSVES